MTFQILDIARSWMIAVKGKKLCLQHFYRTCDWNIVIETLRLHLRLKRCKQSFFAFYCHSKFILRKVEHGVPHHHLVLACNWVRSHHVTCTEIEAPKFKGLHSVYTYHPYHPTSSSLLCLEYSYVHMHNYIHNVSYLLGHTCILLNEGFVKQWGYVQQCFRQSIMKMKLLYANKWWIPYCYSQ